MRVALVLLMFLSWVASADASNCADEILWRDAWTFSWNGQEVSSPRALANALFALNDPDEATRLMARFREANPQADETFMDTVKKYFTHEAIDQIYRQTYRWCVPDELAARRIVPFEWKRQNIKDQRNLADALFALSGPEEGAPFMALFRRSNPGAEEVVRALLDGYFHPLSRCKRYEWCNLH